MVEYYDAWEQAEISLRGLWEKTKKFELYMVDNGKQSEIFREQHLEGDCRKGQETLKKEKA